MKNIAIAVALLVILGGIWLLGTSEKNPEWSTGQVRDNVSQLVRKEKSSDSPMQQTINISLDHPAEEVLDGEYPPSTTVAADELEPRIKADFLHLHLLSVLL